jgi:hypothetical protein
LLFAEGGVMVSVPASACRRALSNTLALLAFACLCTAPTGASAQVLYGSIVGNVIDESGAALPGAAVTITHAATGNTRETVTDDTGTYRFPTLQPGTYTVTVALPGFSHTQRAGVVVTLNNITRSDMTLQIGQLSETVTVEARSVLQTDRAEVRAELNTRELENLPVPMGRNYQRLFKVIPGFSPPADAHSVPSNPSRALTFNVNGTSQSANNTRIDGVSTTNIWLPHVAAYVPALESLETVNVVTNSFDAEQGLAGGAAINVQIKSGTNTLRGSAFEYHTNEALRANDYFAPPGTPKGKWRYHQFGATAGGPVVRNHLFYFVSYEGTRDRQNVSRTFSVPTEALRRGDLSASATPIYDPATGNPDGSGRTAFAGNVIPAGRIDPIAAKMIPLLPLPNLPGEQNNYFVQAPFVFNRWTVDSKVNWTPSSTVNLFGRYSMLDFTQDNATAFGDQMQGPPIGGGNPGFGSGKTHNFSGGLTYTMTSNMVLDAHVGWVRMNTGVEQTDVRENKGIDWLGIPGTNGRRPFEGGMPRFGVSGYTAWGVTESYMPYYRSDDQIQNVINLNWLKGRHNIRFGTDIYYQAMNHTQPEFIGTSQGARGGFDFGTGPTQIRGGPSGTNFNGWATFLLGLPTQLGRLHEAVAPYTTRNWHYSLYVRDQWQASSKLTIAYGTRWEYFPVPTRADRGLERYNWRTDSMEIGGIGSVPMDLGVKVSKTMFAPRLGVVYRATPSTVLRAGYGLTNDPYALARPMRTNHPILLNLVVNAPHSWGWAGTLAGGIPPIADPDLGNGIIPVPGNVSVVTLPDEFNRGYIHSWNAAMQRELLWGFVGEAAYVGTRQVNQLGFRELNWSPIGGGQAGRQLNQQFGRTAQTRLVAPVGNTSYHALQTRLERRFADGFQVGVNYTLSRNKGIAGAPNSDGAPRINIPEYYHLNYGLSDIDRPHSFHLSNIVELPFGTGRRWLNGGGVTSAIVGGWQVNNIVSFFSGTPFNVTSGGASLNAPESQQRADLVGTPRILGGTGRGNPYFDPMAFRPVTEARFGTAPWNVLRGPGFWSWDFGLFRELRLMREKTLQLRFEGFNMLNTPRFNNPGGNVSNLQLNPDGSIRNLNGFSEITGTAGGSERQMRLGLRFGF